MGFKMIHVSEISASLLRIYSFFFVCLFYFFPVRGAVSSVKLDKNPTHLLAVLPVLLSPVHSAVAQHFEHNSL